MKLNLACITLLFSYSALATDCFEIKQNSPASEPHMNTEKWCYESQTANGKNYQLIFNVDSDIKAELSFLVSPIENLVTHGSFKKGRLSYSKVHISDFNPLPVPVSSKGLASRVSVQLRSEQEAQKSEVLAELFQQSQKLSVERSIYKVSEGVIADYLPEELYPFRGYWWPYQQTELAKGDHAPLRFYDNLIPNLYKNWQPKSMEWELNNHSLTHVAWGGHCNGWAASSILHTEPTQYLWDEYNDQVIYPVTIQGLLAENSFCVNLAFYGTRFNDSAKDDLQDIHADQFHKVLLYYIKKLQKPVAMDYFQDVPVDNHVISGYNMDIKKESESRYVVTARLQIHGYEMFMNGFSGKAPIYERAYSYYLDVNANQEITGGEWISSNPDFLWVPLSEADCGRENPHLKQKAIAQIRNLPEAKWKTTLDDFAIDEVITESKEVEIPLNHINGVGPIIHYSFEDMSYDDYFSFTGTSYYWIGEIQGTAYVSDGNVLNLGSFGIDRVTDLTVVLRNASTRPERRKLKIEKIDYFGKP